MDAPQTMQAISEGILAAPDEVLLGGLQPGRVVKVGETVRRAAGPWTATVQALLAHLQSKGFPAPRPLGVDDQGREIVSYLTGRASNWPWPPALLAIDGARQIGTLLKTYHRAAADFAPAFPTVWRHGPEALKAGQVALHGDFGPHNLVWSETSLTGVIDFELAQPGDPMEDVGFAVIRAAQLRPDDMTRLVGFESPPDRAARLAAFGKGYGAPTAVLVGAALAAQRSEIDRIVRLGGAGIEPWATFLTRGLADQARVELAWIEANAAALT
jgi:hypothetical protein